MTVSAVLFFLFGISAVVLFGSHDAWSSLIARRAALARGRWPRLHTLHGGPLLLAPDRHNRFDIIAHIGYPWIPRLPRRMWRRLPPYEEVLVTPLGNGNEPYLCLIRTVALIWLKDPRRGVTCDKSTRRKMDQLAHGLFGGEG